MAVQRRIRFEDGREATLAFDSEPSEADIIYAAGLADERTRPSLLSRVGKAASGLATALTPPPNAQFKPITARPQVPWQAPEAVAAQPVRQGPQPVPLPPPPPAPLPPTELPQELPAGHPVMTAEELARGRAEAVQPAPIMQSAVEGAGIGAMGGGLQSALRIGAEMAAGAKAAELAEPAIEKIPGEGPIPAVLREALRQGVFMAPGMGAEGLMARWRGRSRPAAAPEPVREAVPEPVAVPPPAPEQVPPVAVPGPIGGEPAPPPELPPEPPPAPVAAAVQAPAEIAQPAPAAAQPEHVPSYGEKYIAENGIPGAIARVAELDFKIYNDPTYTGYMRQNLISEADNIRRALDIAQPRAAAQEAALPPAPAPIPEPPQPKPKRGKKAAKAVVPESPESLDRDMLKAHAVYSKEFARPDFPQASVDNLKASIARFIERGVPDDNFRLKELRGLLDKGATAYKPAPFEQPISGPSAQRKGAGFARFRLMPWDYDEALNPVNPGAVKTAKNISELMAKGHTIEDMFVEPDGTISFSLVGPAKPWAGRRPNYQPRSGFPQFAAPKGKLPEFGEGESAEIGAELGGVSPEQAYREAQAKLAALGPEPPKPSNERKRFGYAGRAKAPPEEVRRYDEEVKAHNRWKQQYSKLKKAEVAAANTYAASKRGLGERGAFELPAFLAEPAEKIRKTAIGAAKWITPKSFASEDAINIAIRAKGEQVEQARVAYEQRSRGNVAFFDRLIGKQGKQATYDFIGRIMRGEPQPTPELQAKDDFYRALFDEMYHEVNKIKSLRHRQNYWPFADMWKNKDEEVSRVFSGRRPLAGRKGFFRRKVFEDIEHGLARGLEPVDPNPEILVRTWLEGVRRFKYGNQLFTNAKEHGLLTWKPVTTPMPEGKAKIHDPIVERYFPPDQVPVSIKREELLQNVLQRYMRVYRRERTSTGPSRTTSTTETTTGGEATTAPASKIEERVREALTARGFASGEAQQYIDRLKNAKPGAESRTVVKEITERTRTVERERGVSFEGLPEDVRMKGRVLTQRFVKAGEWIADEGFARLINNSLSPDNLRSDGTLRGIAVLNAKLNAVELMGMFHVQNEAWNIWASKFGQASRQLGTGHPWRAFKKALAAPGAPLVDVIRGGKMLNSPELLYGEFSPLAHGMRLAKPTGAFAPGSAVENFVRAWRRREPGEAFKNLFGATIDGAMMPVFKFMVPRMQIAAYYDILGDEFDRLGIRMEKTPEGIWQIAENRGDFDPHTVARKVFESVQNRMGMVNYDSWFWNHTFKSIMQATFRAPGWNFGYGFEMGGAIQDIARNIRPQPGRPRPGFTPKMQFFAGMALAQLIGAEIYQVLRTGKHIESLQDVYAPRNGQIDQNGNEVRVRFANVFKDFYGGTHDLIGTMFNKLAPVPVELVRFFISNRDYYGDYIRNKDDPASEQLKQAGEYALGLGTPFSLQQFLRGRVEGGPHGGEALMGVTRAPQEVIQSEAQQTENRLLRQLHRAAGPRTPEQKRDDALKFHAREALRRGDEGPLNELVAKWHAEGVPQKSINERFRAIIRSAQETPEERRRRLLGPVGRQRLEGLPLSSNPPPVP